MIDVIWNVIINNQGEIFKQIKGKEFTYKIKGNSIRLTTTNRVIPKSQILKALDRFPFENTTKIQDLQAPSYIYGIMMDDRIKKLILK